VWWGGAIVTGMLVRYILKEGSLRISVGRCVMRPSILLEQEGSEML